MYRCSTWEAYGNGRVLKSSTGASGQTGGSETATLTANNLPSHSHSLNSHTHTSNSKSTASAGAHTHTVTGTCASAGAHTHTVSGTCASAGAHTHSCSTTATTAKLRIDNSYLAWFDNLVACGGNNWGFGGGGIRVGYVEIPRKTATSSNPGNHTHSISSGSAASAGAHTHSISASKASAASAGGHKHTISITTGAATGNTGSAGSGTSFSVLDPYITVYMYKRTA